MRIILVKHSNMLFLTKILGLIKFSITRFCLVLLLSVMFIGYTCAVSAQAVGVGSAYDVSLRSMQLMGKLDPAVSFTARPFNPGNLSYHTVYGMIDENDSATLGKPVPFFKGKGSFQFLPIGFTQQYNTHHPYGWNDGSMIAAKGYQAQISAGFRASFGPLEMQFQPEAVFAANPKYPSNFYFGNPGPGSYTRVLTGQSYLRLAAGPVAVGISTANIWWGPGMNSSLLMSNNAPGFLHAFIGTRKPLKTPIGNFEFQLIGGKLTSEKGEAYENYNLKPEPLSLRGRYLNGYVVSYNPRGLPGLFLGMTRALQRYRADVDNAPGSFIDKYLPVISKPFQKKNVFNDDTLNTDQLASFFLRWLFVKAHAEFYVEYGFNDYGVNARDYAMAPTHSAAYILGFKKIYPLLKKNTQLEIGMEVTQMSESPDQIVRPAGNWYEHFAILQGYTNNNQILGAGAGLGCNVQSINATWVSGWKRLGVLLERLEHDPLKNIYNWVDYSIGVLPQWRHKNMIFAGKIQFIKSDHYAWDVKGSFNVHAKFSIQYLF